MSTYQMNKHKFLSDAEMNKLRESLKRKRYSDPRNTLMIELLLATGARRQELLNITHKDFWEHDDFGVVMIKGIKGSKDREVPISHELYARLRDFCGSTKGKVFTITTKRLEQVWHMYRPTNKGIHSTRHTFAIQVFKKHRDLRLVQMALGHKNIQNTMVYADYVYSVEEMSKLLSAV